MEATCERCGRVVMSRSFDFGGFVLDPTCEGIEVKVRAENDLLSSVCFITADELRHFLASAYGDPRPS